MGGGDFLEKLKAARAESVGSKTTTNKRTMTDEEIDKAFSDPVEKKSPNESEAQESQSDSGNDSAKPVPLAELPSAKSGESQLQNKLLGNQTLQQAMEKSPSENAFGLFKQEKNLQDVSKNLLAKNSHLNFIQRAIDPDKYPVIKNDDGSFSTHLMAWGEGPKGKPIVFPTIVQQKDGTLKKFDNMDDAYNHAVKNNEYVETPNDETAAYFSEHGYKQSPFFHQQEDPNVLKQGLSPAQEARKKATSENWEGGASHLDKTVDQSKESNPLVTGYKTMKDFVVNTVPKTAASVAALMPNNPHLMAPEYARQHILPNQSEEQKENLKKGAIEARKNLVDYSIKQDEESAKETSNLTKSLGDVHGFGDLMNYVVHNTANAAAQIPLAVLTGGGSAVMQETGNHYIEGVQEIAKRKGISPSEVIEKGLDQPAIAIASGALAGGLETLGAKGVAGAINTNALWGTVRDKAYKMFKSTAGEGLTEGLQNVVEQSSKNLQGGDNAGEALSKIDKKEVLENTVGGAVGALGLHGISSAGKAAIDKVATLTTKKHQIDSDLGKEEITPVSKDILQTEKETINNELEKAKKEVHDEHEKVVEGKVPPQTSPTAEEVPERKEAAPAPETLSKKEEKPEIGEMESKDIDKMSVEELRGHLYNVAPNWQKHYREYQSIHSPDLPSGKANKKVRQKNIIEYGKESAKYADEKDNGEYRKTLKRYNQIYNNQSNSEKYKNEIALLDEAYEHAEDSNKKSIESTISQIEYGDDPNKTIKDNLNKEWYKGALPFVHKTITELGGHQYHKSENDASGSVYYELPNGEKLRISDHELPDTEERRENREKGIGGGWIDHVLDKPKPFVEIKKQITDSITNEPTKTILPTSEGEIKKPEEEQKVVSRETLVNKELTNKDQEVENEEPEKIPKESDEKERKFTKRVFENKNLSKEFKEGISEDAKNYIPRSLKLNEDEAKEYIAQKGEEEALHDIDDHSNGMLPDNRVAIGINLMQHYENKATEALKQGDQVTADRYNEKANRAQETTAKTGTKLGQAVSAFRLFASPERAVYNTRKALKEQRNAIVERDKEKIKQKFTAVKEANEETVKEVTKTKKVKEGIAKVKGKQAVTPKPVDLTKEKIKEGIKSAEEELHKLFKESASRATSGVDPVLAAKIIKAGSKLIYHHIANGVHDLKVLKDKLIEKFGSAIEPYADDIINGEHKGKNLKELATEVKTYEVTNNTQKAILDNLEERLEDVVKKHYTEVDKTKKALSEKIVKELDLPEAQAKELSKLIEDEFDRLATEKKRKALNKLKPRVAKKKEHEQLHEQIIKLSNLGALDEETTQQLYADKFGLPELTAEQAARVKELANRVQKATKGEAKNKASQDLINYQTKIVGVPIGEIAQSIWYAKVLSGLSTQATNIYANFTETLGELTVLALQDPKSTGFLLKNLYNGWARGALVSKDVLKTGYQPVKDLKVETSGVLENITFKGGIWNPENYLKYVGRAMTAADILFYHGVKEMRAAQIAYIKNKGDQQKAIELLYKTPEQLQEARDEAIEEGLKGDAYKRRVNELMEDSRPNEVTDEAHDFAARATFNYEPEGALGALTSAINNMTNAVDYKGIKPLKFIVPFSRVIANVANRGLDWSPWGYARYAKGQIGWDSKLTSQFTHRYTEEERARVLTKAILGTVAMAALYALTEDWDDDGKTDLEITADGTGDRQKNYQLQETGWRPYSIRMGNKWYEYKFTPISIPLALIGYVRDQQKYKGEKDVLDKVSIAAFGTINYLMSLNALGNLSEFFNSFSKDNPDGGADFFKKMEKSVVKTAKGFVVPNLINQGLRTYQEAFDMPIKRSHDMVEDAIKDYPVFNDKLDNLYNVLGEPVVPDQVSKFVPFKVQVKEKGEEHDKVWNLIIDNQAFISVPSKANVIFDPNTEEDRLFTDKELNEFGRRKGQLIKEKILENYDEIKAMPKSEAQDKLKEIYDEAGAETKEHFFE